MSIGRLLSLFTLTAVLVASSARAQPTTPEEAAKVRTDSLLQQLTHVANKRDITPCEAYTRFHTVRPFDGALDPWGRRIEFECQTGVLVVRSIGADGQSGTADDIVSGKAPGPTISAAPPPDASSSPRPEDDASGFPLAGWALVLVAAIAAWVVVQDVRS